jgi:hypothetical protein
MLSDALFEGMEKIKLYRDSNLEAYQAWYWGLDPAAVDGSEVAAGVLYDAVDASAADAEGVAIVRLAEVNATELVWPDGITGPEQTTALGEVAALNIIAR